MRVLVDSSVWIDFLNGDQRTLTLSDMIIENVVVTHDLVEAELRAGFLNTSRDSFFRYFCDLPRLMFSDIPGIFDFIERKQLYGRGLSFIDLTLLIAAIVDQAVIWTHDKNFKKACLQFGIAYHS
jgi:predicted nucleic acid-binding protein